jgi:hypothetical protein
VISISIRTSRTPTIVRALRPSDWRQAKAIRTIGSIGRTFAKWGRGLVMLSLCETFG